MSGQPTVFDTTNLDQSSFNQMAQMLASDIGSGKNYSVTGPNADSLLNAAFAINGTTNPTTGQVASVSTPSNSTAGAPNQAQSWSQQIAANTAYAAKLAIDPIGTVADSSGVTTAATRWISSHAGNYGLVIFGAILALGALLISQRETIIKVTKTAGEAA